MHLNLRTLIPKSRIGIDLAFIKILYILYFIHSFESPYQNSYDHQQYIAYVA